MTERACMPRCSRADMDRGENVGRGSDRGSDIGRGGDRGSDRGSDDQLARVPPPPFPAESVSRVRACRPRAS